MAVRTLAYLAGIVIACGGSLFSPLIGVAGYIVHYNLGAGWYMAPIRQMGVRTSLMLGIFTAVGMVLSHATLRYGRRILHAQETLVLLLLAMVWAYVWLGPATDISKFSVVDHPSMKFTKIIFFAFMFTHVVTTVRRLDIIFWVLVLCTLQVGYEAWGTPRSAFTGGRLQGIGGVDFWEANALAAFIAAMLPFVAVRFLTSGWVGKIVCLGAGAFGANTIILTRSRGAVVGVVFGAIAALGFAPKRYRLKASVGIAVVAVAFLMLADPMFMDRTSTTVVETEQRDSSAQSRIVIWQGAMAMVAENPMGVGVGNFEQTIGTYAPEYPNMDAHNTFVRCIGELGVPGITLFLLVLWKAVATFRGVFRRAGQIKTPDGRKFTFMCYVWAMSFAVYLGCSMTMTLLWIEGFWWIIMLPVCLERALDNYEGDPRHQADRELAKAAKQPARKRRPSRKKQVPDNARAPEHDPIGA